MAQEEEEVGGGGGVLGLGRGHRRIRFLQMLAVDPGGVRLLFLVGGRGRGLTGRRIDFDWPAG